MGISRILVIDDQEAIHQDYVKILANNSHANQDVSDLLGKIFDEEVKDVPSGPTYSLDHAYQGKDGFEMIQKALEENNPYQLVFVDMRMPPGWDGLETISHIWKIDQNVETVLCTAYSDYSWSDIIDKVGVSDRLLILKKPFDAIEITQMASALTKKWKLSHQMNLLVNEQKFKIEEQQLKIHEEKKWASFGMMVGGVAHEINNPLAIINGNIDYIEKLMKRNSDPHLDQFQPRFTVIRDTVKRIATVISKMRQLIFQGDFEKKPVSLKLLIEAILVSCREKFEISELELNIEHSSDELNVMAIEVELHQAFQHVLINAYEAVMSLSEKKWIKVNTVLEEQKIIVTISNSGSLPKDIDLSKVFEPFFTTKQVTQALGLGLSITQKILKDHDGKIELDEKSEFPQFIITLPLYKK